MFENYIPFKGCGKALELRLGILRSGESLVLEQFAKLNGLTKSLHAKLINYSRVCVLFQCVPGDLCSIAPTVASCALLEQVLSLP